MQWKRSNLKKPTTKKNLYYPYQSFLSNFVTLHFASILVALILYLNNSQKISDNKIGQLVKEDIVGMFEGNDENTQITCKYHSKISNKKAMQQQHLIVPRVPGPPGSTNSSSFFSRQTFQRSSSFSRREFSMFLTNGAFKFANVLHVTFFELCFLRASSLRMKRFTSAVWFITNSFNNTAASSWQTVSNSTRHSIRPRNCLEASNQIPTPFCTISNAQIIIVDAFEGAIMHSCTKMLGLGGTAW